MAWHRESYRHSLSARGIKTSRKLRAGGVFSSGSGIWVASEDDLSEPWFLTLDEFLTYSLDVNPEPFNPDRFSESAFILPSGEYVYLDWYQHQHYLGKFDKGWIRKSSWGDEGTPAYEVKSWSKNIENLILDDILSFPSKDKHISIDIADEGKGYGLDYKIIWQNDFKLRKAFKDFRTTTLPYVSSFDDVATKEVRETNHKYIIQKALDEGKNVSQRVLSDYPELMEDS